MFGRKEQKLQKEGKRAECSYSFMHQHSSAAHVEPYFKVSPQFQDSNLGLFNPSPRSTVHKVQRICKSILVLELGHEKHYLDKLRNQSPFDIIDFGCQHKTSSCHHLPVLFGDETLQDDFLKIYIGFSYYQHLHSTLEQQIYDLEGKLQQIFIDQHFIICVSMHVVLLQTFSRITNHKYTNITHSILEFRDIC